MQEIEVAIADGGKFPWADDDSASDFSTLYGRKRKKDICLVWMDNRDRILFPRKNWKHSALRRFAGAAYARIALPEDVRDSLRGLAADLGLEMER
jgi:hypothetical protein